MNKIFFFGIVAILFSCDPYSEAYLCNESGGPVQITIKIDKEFVDKNWKGDQKTQLLKQFGALHGLTEIAIDTVSLRGEYRLENANCALLYEGISTKPEFVFNYLEIKAVNKNIIYATRHDVESAFLPSDGGRYALVFKE